MEMCICDSFDKIKIKQKRNKYLQFYGNKIMCSTHSVRPKKSRKQECYKGICDILKFPECLHKACEN